MAHARTKTTDYIATILIAGGSSYGRSPNKDEAIKAALRIYKADWGKVFNIKKGDKVVVNVVDVFPHKEVAWDNRGFWVGDEPVTRKIEKIERRVP